MENEESSQEKEYPSVDTAFEFSKMSYSLMLSRFEAIDSKIQQLLSMATAVTVATPVFTKAIGVSFSSPYAYAGLSIYIVFVILGIVGMRMGRVRLVDPGAFVDYLHKSPWAFKKDGIYHAGEDFKKNKATINAKGWIRDIMIGLLFLEIISIIAWIATAARVI